MPEGAVFPSTNTLAAHSHIVHTPLIPENPAWVILHCAAIHGAQMIKGLSFYTQ